MTCYAPLKGYRSARQTKNNNYRIVVTGKDHGPATIVLPCGQCIGCRLARSREWAIRCVHEAEKHDENSFITLTYNKENLPPDHSLNKDHFQRFMKRLRKYLAPKKIRYFHCGEYGDKFNRPHYHALLFGHSFTDQTLFKVFNGIPSYTSSTLDSLWGLGYCTIGQVNFQSAAYVARYITKKINGPEQYDHYWYDDPLTGQCWPLQPEYLTMSLKPGIGSTYFEENYKDMLPFDHVVMRTKENTKPVELKVPRYYLEKYESINKEEHTNVKNKRAIKAKKQNRANTPRRLADMKKCKERQAKRLIRELEEN